MESQEKSKTKETLMKYLDDNGKLKAGIYENVSYREYDNIPALRSTYLCKLAETPALARAADPDQTQAMIFGTAFHVYTLEGEQSFNNQYSIAGHCSAELKSGQKKGQRCINSGIVWDGQDWFCGQHSKSIIACEHEKIILTPEDVKLIKAMAYGINTHPTAKQLMQNGKAEVVAVWKDQETGLWCKARVDWLPDATDGVIIDLKSAASSNSFAFDRAVRNNHYHVQAAMYMEGLKAVGLNPELFGFVVSEKKIMQLQDKNITRCEIMQLDDTYLEAGHGRFRELLKIEAECQKSGYWPHYKNAGADILIAPGFMEV